MAWPVLVRVPLVPHVVRGTAFVLLPTTSTNVRVHARMSRMAIPAMSMPGARNGEVK